MLHKLRAYESIARLLQDASFPSLIVRTALVNRRTALAKKFNEGLAQVLSTLDRFAMHRPLLLATNRGF